MNILFLTHASHETHRQEAMKEIGARIKVLPYLRFINLIKKSPFFMRFFPYLSLIYSFFINVEKEDILIVDGGSCIYSAAHIKKRNKKIKIVYIDNDMQFYVIDKNPQLKEKMKFFLDSIDGILCESEQNKKYSSRVLDVPIEMWTDFPNPIKKQKVKRKNYGLYVGRLDPEKNIERIIQVGLECPFLEKFIVIGSGAMENYVRKMAKKHKKIIFLGTKKNVEKYYSMCKFLIHLPDYDPHPKTTMEAVLCGCFPIVSKKSGTNYLFDKIFVVDNPESFYEASDKIEYILDNEKKAKKLLEKNLHLIPTKEKSLKQLKSSFSKIIEKIK